MPRVEATQTPDPKYQADDIQEFDEEPVLEPDRAQPLRSSAIGALGDCFVSSYNEIRSAIEEGSSCTRVIVEPGDYRQTSGYTWFRASGVTLECAVFNECDFGAIIISGDNNIMRSFKLASNEKLCFRIYGDGNLYELNECEGSHEDAGWVWGENNTIRLTYNHGLTYPYTTSGSENHTDCWMTWAWAQPSYYQRVRNILFDRNVCVLERAPGDDGFSNVSNQFFIYTHSSSSVPITDIIFDRNVFGTNDTGYIPIALYGDSSTTGMEVVNNTFYGGLDNGVYLSGQPSGSVLVEDNLCYGCRSSFVRGSGAVQSGNQILAFDGHPDYRALWISMIKDQEPPVTSTNTPAQAPPTNTNTPNPPIPSATPFDGLTFNARDGEIVEPFVIVDEQVRQTVLTTDSANGGQASYRFTIEESGEYLVRVMVDAPSTASNSFFVNVDGDPSSTMIWDVQPTNGLDWRYVSMREDSLPETYKPAHIYQLEAGTHILIVRGREANASLFSFEIVPSAGVTPTPSATASLTPTNTHTQIPSPTETPSPTNTATPAPNYYCTPDPADIHCFLAE